MAEGVVVCVDAGTTVIKAVVFDAAGRELRVAQTAAAVRQPSPGCSEQDMHEVWTAVVATVRAAISGMSWQVQALAVTAQGDGAWLVDGAGEPVRPAVLWNDARAVGVVEAWQRQGVLAEAFRRTGSLGNAGLPHAVLTVLRHEEPAVLARSRAVLTCGGWLFLRLTGVLGIDRSEASAPWLDLRPDPAARPLVDLYGLDDLADLLPPVLTESERVQGLTAPAAALLGLPVGLPVVIAPYDIAATAVGAGATAPGQAVSILGTTLCTESVLAAGEAVPGPDATPSGLTLDLGCGGLFLRSFPTLSGTGVLEWAAGLLDVADAASVVALAAEAEPGAAGLTVLPYLSPAGERAPFLDTAARGVISGLTFAHRRTHVARAVLEGLAHVVRDCLDATRGSAAELRVCGGGAASEVWLQIIADVTGCAVVRTVDSQVGAKGALVVALTALGHYPDLPDAAAALVRDRDRREPDAAVRALYEDRHAAFLADRALVAPMWHRRTSATVTGQERVGV
ncbi:MAG TPA: FGGY family carbohydrate kinase [Pseudonocardia sp.]